MGRALHSVFVFHPAPEAPLPAAVVKTARPARGASERGKGICRALKKAASGDAASRTVGRAGHVSLRTAKRGVVSGSRSAAALRWPDRDAENLEKDENRH